jgi:hypothetical protein
MGKYLGAVLAVLVAAGVVTGVAFAVGYYSRPLPTWTPATGGSIDRVPAVSITLQTFANSPYQDPDFIASHVTGKDDNGFPFPPPGDNQGWVTYWPTTNFQVPTHTLVTINIENYDGATPLLNPFYATARGTMGGTMTVDGQTVTQALPDDTGCVPCNVSHTFTIHSLVGQPATQPWLFVSVPLTAEPSDAKTDSGGIPLQPVVTSFSFMTPDKPGHYIWQCFDPCGTGFNGFGGPMSTKGYMSGTLDVVG